MLELAYKHEEKLKELFMDKWYDKKVYEIFRKDYIKSKGDK